MQNYDLNKKKATPKQEATVPAGPTILSASSPNPAQTKCTTCSEMFNTTMRKVGTGIYTICFKCSTKARKAREVAAAHPTPAQVAGAQASLKKAQAVLLAASVADKPTSDPAIAPPTQRDLNTISNYVESSYYSLTATTTTTQDQATNPSDVPIIASFLLDSGASLSVTNALADLLQPTQLPTPIPITSADGTTIHATHVGTSSLGTLIHYVPSSAVELVSLGSLTASGYMVHTKKDRSIVITKSNGTILCSCPVQLNNTWIFPRQLMTGNLSPATAVPTGISGPPGATVLPFRIPREPQHFTKEEVNHPS